MAGMGGQHAAPRHIQRAGGRAAAGAGCRPARRRRQRLPGRRPHHPGRCECARGACHVSPPGVRGACAAPATCSGRPAQPKRLREAPSHGLQSPMGAPPPLAWPPLPADCGVQHVAAAAPGWQHAGSSGRLLGWHRQDASGAGSHRPAAPPRGAGGGCHAGRAGSRRSRMESSPAQAAREGQAQHPGELRTPLPAMPACAADGSACAADGSAVMLQRALLGSQRQHSSGLRPSPGRETRPGLGLPHAPPAACADHKRPALRQQRAPPGQHHRLCAERGRVRALLPQPRAQCHLHLRHR